MAAAATPGTDRKAREAIFVGRKDEPQRRDRKASPAYAAMNSDSMLGGK